MSQRRSQRKATSSRERLSAADRFASRGLRGPRGGEPGLGGTILCMALALVAGAIFLAQALSPASFLSAYRQVEFGRFLDAERSKSQGQTNWEDLQRAVAGRLNGTDLLKRRKALADLFDDVMMVDRSASSVTMSGDELLNHNPDRDNLVARLCAAVIEDAHRSAAASGPAESAALVDRFNRVAALVDQSTPVARIMTHNDELSAVREDVLSVYLSRPDVLATWDWEDHFLSIHRHLTAIQTISRRLNGLATSLEFAGLSTEARRCRGWIRRMLWGLLTTEREPTTRLLCADLLATQVDVSTKSRDNLRRLVDDYVAQASAAPVDRADIQGRNVAVMPDQYRTVLNRLAAALSAALAGAGAWLAALICLLAALVTRRSRAIVEHGVLGEPTEIRPTVNWLHATMTGLAISVACMGLRLYVSGRGISENWAFVSVIVSMAIGFVVPVLFPPQYWDRLARTVVAMVLALGLFGAVFATPTTIGWALRGALFRSHPLIVVAVIAHLFCFASLFISTAAWRRKANWAAITSLVWLGLGLVGYQLHRVADDAYLARVAEARADEFASRLGSGWQDRYLADVKKTILEDRP